jgi:hypothetical protein
MTAWIKVQHSTPNKPEILRLARVLGVSKDDAFGKVVRFWMWMDDVSVDGRVDAVVDADVDAVVSHDGFARALQSVGWLTIDDSGAFVATPNFDRHNGESAKKRAEKARRQKKWRDGGADVGANVDARAPQESLPDKSKSKSNKTASAVSPTSSADDDGHLSPDWVLSTWNEAAERAGVPKARAMTADRTAKARKRLRHPGWADTFVEATERLPVPNDERFQWQPDLDWMLANETNALKIVEGKYERRAVSDIPF